MGILQSMEAIEDAERDLLLLPQARKRHRRDRGPTGPAGPQSVGIGPAGTVKPGHR
jgi:hypothetical protein